MKISLTIVPSKDGTLQPFWDVLNFSWGDPQNEPEVARVVLLALENGADDEGEDAPGPIEDDAYGCPDSPEGSASVATTQPEQTPDDMAPSPIHPRRLTLSGATAEVEEGWGVLLLKDSIV